MVLRVTIANLHWQISKWHLKRPKLQRCRVSWQTPRLTICENFFSGLQWKIGYHSVFIQKCWIYALEAHFATSIDIFQWFKKFWLKGADRCKNVHKCCECFFDQNDPHRLQYTWPTQQSATKIDTVLWLFVSSVSENQACPNNCSARQYSGTVLQGHKFAPFQLLLIRRFPYILADHGFTTVQAHPSFVVWGWLDQRAVVNSGQQE